MRVERRRSSASSNRPYASGKKAVPRRGTYDAVNCRDRSKRGDSEPFSNGETRDLAPWFKYMGVVFMPQPLLLRRKLRTSYLDRRSDHQEWTRSSRERRGGSVPHADLSVRGRG